MASKVSAADTPSLTALKGALGKMVNRTPILVGPKGVGLDPLPAFNMWISRGKTTQEALQIMFDGGTDFANQRPELKANLKATGMTLTAGFSVVASAPSGTQGGGGAATSFSSTQRVSTSSLTQQSKSASARLQARKESVSLKARAIARARRGSAV